MSSTSSVSSATTPTSSALTSLASSTASPSTPSTSTTTTDTSGGATSINFSGLASGIDSNAIIAAAMAEGRLAEQPLQSQINDDNNESAALQNFNSQLLGISSSLQSFTTVAGQGLTKSGTSSDPNSVDVSVSDSAPLSVSTVTVQSLAKGATFSFLDQFSSPTTPVAPNISGSETITVKVGTGSSEHDIPVNVTNTTTLNDIVGQINADTNGVVSASAVNLGTDNSPGYALVLNSTSTGTATGSIQVDVSAGLKSAGIFQNSSLDQAQDAVFTISGVGTVTRASNKISGIIPGVTFQLKQVTSTPTQITVGTDAATTATNFSNAIGLLNSAIQFSQTNSAVTTDSTSTAEVTNTFGPLAHTQVDEQAIRSIKDAMSDAFAAGGTSVRTFSDLGLKTNEDGTISIDSDKFTAALQADPVGAGQLLNQFADKVGAPGGVIDGYTQYQGTIANAVSSNTDEVTNLQDRINTIEANLAAQQASLKLIYANLESTVSGLTSASSALSSLASSNAATA